MFRITGVLKVIKGQFSAAFRLGQTINQVVSRCVASSVRMTPQAFAKGTPCANLPTLARLLRLRCTSERSTSDLV